MKKVWYYIFNSFLYFSDQHFRNFMPSSKNLEGLLSKKMNFPFLTKNITLFWYRGLKVISDLNVCIIECCPDAKKLRYFKFLTVGNILKVVDNLFDY